MTRPERLALVAAVEALRRVLALHADWAKSVPPELSRAVNRAILQVSADLLVEFRDEYRKVPRDSGADRTTKSPRAKVKA